MTALVGLIGAGAKATGPTKALLIAAAIIFGVATILGLWWHAPRADGVAGRPFDWSVLIPAGLCVLSLAFLLGSSS